MACFHKQSQSVPNIRPYIISGLAPKQQSIISGHNTQLEHKRMRSEGLNPHRRRHGVNETPANELIYLNTLLRERARVLAV